VILLPTAIQKFATGAVVTGGGNDMNARQANESDEDGHSELGEHV